MKQLMMYRLQTKPVEPICLPEGYSVSNYAGAHDRAAWCQCCRNGLIPDDAGEEMYIATIADRKQIEQTRDVFFLDYAGSHVGTITA